MKYVFVCGLHRSGTTILAQSVARLRNCTGLDNTGAPRDEGQFLQDVYPREAAYGGVGKFGFAAEAHMTEDSPLLTPANVSRLRQSWEPHWDRDKTIRVEKTPSNLLKTRFLQAGFPNAYFVVIKRHPVPVSLASQKWSRTPLHNLLEHWLRCYEIFDLDREHLNRVYEVAYEEFVKSPERHLDAIAKFIGTERSSSVEGEVTDGHNRQYFERWTRMLRGSPFKSYYRCIVRTYEKRFRQHDYSLVPLSPEPAFSPNGEGAIPRSLAQVLYLGADIQSVLWRAETGFRRVARPIVRHYWPGKVKTNPQQLGASED